MGHVAVGTSTNGATFKIPGRYFNYLITIVTCTWFVLTLLNAQVGARKYKEEKRDAIIVRIGP